MSDASSSDSLNWDDIPPEVQEEVKRLSKEGKNPSVKMIIEKTVDHSQYLLDKENAEKFVRHEKAKGAFIVEPKKVASKESSSALTPGAASPAQGPPNEVKSLSLGSTTSSPSSGTHTQSATGANPRSSTPKVRSGCSPQEGVAGLAFAGYKSPPRSTSRSSRRSRSSSGSRSSSSKSGSSSRDSSAGSRSRSSSRSSSSGSRSSSSRSGSRSKSRTGGRGRKAKTGRGVSRRGSSRRSAGSRSKKSRTRGGRRSGGGRGRGASKSTKSRSGGRGRRGRGRR